MMAASARTSGTSAPDSSSLKRGSAMSFASRASRVALARAAAARRLRAVEVVFFEVVVVLSARRGELVRVEDERLLPAASDSAGKPKPATIANRQISRTNLNSLEV